MREILFRGKRTNNGEWVKGNLFVPDLPNTPTQICIGTNVVRITYDVIPETVGQYTGLTDKNGKKIFEGDICKHRSNYSGDFIISVVTYTDGYVDVIIVSEVMDDTTRAQVEDIVKRKLEVAADKITINVIANKS